MDKTPPNTEPEQVTLNDAASVIEEENEEELETDVYDMGRFVDPSGHHTSNLSLPLNEQLLSECQSQLANGNNSIRVVHRLDNPATHEIILDLHNPLEECHLLSAEEAGHVIIQHSSLLGEEGFLEYIDPSSSVENSAEREELEMLEGPFEHEAGEPEQVVDIQAFN